jgi:hypothetical protein
MPSKNIVELMRVSPPSRDTPWLQEALRNAVQLELATLPPYLCIYWSIKERNTIAAQLISSIFMQEMKHMGLAANMLVGVGGTPEIFAARPSYPGPLPGGVRPELTVYLAGLTQEYVKEICMQIEMPEHPLAKGIQGETFPTIGAFYDAIIGAFEHIPGLTITENHQVESGRSDIWKIKDVAGAVEAVNIIKLEGEGTTESPDESSDVPAHYYKFGSILHGKSLIKKDGNWVWEGDEVPFPAVWPMGRVLAGGWPTGNMPTSVRDLLKTFNDAYKGSLLGLQRAWTGDPKRPLLTGEDLLNEAIGAMQSLGGPAVDLMKIPVGGHQMDCGENYGPDFRV